MGTHTRTIAVTINLGSEPIAGTVRGPDGARLEFVGYMQLIAQLERHHHAESAIDKHPAGEAQEPC